jgi:hypothetical protein
MSAKMSPEVEEILTHIAKIGLLVRPEALAQRYGVENAKPLESTNSGADFYEVGVGSLREALHLAYLQGYNAGMRNAIKAVKESVKKSDAVKSPAQF